MAKRRKKKQAPPVFDIDWNDARIKRIGAISLVFFASYLFIAFTSYIFTWQIDQDKVQGFSFATLFAGDFVTANWLGRLGAIISNAFFYWGVGLSSFVVPVLLGYYGIRKLAPSKLNAIPNFTGYMVIGGLVFSVFLEFVFSGSAFAWGGAVGSEVCAWLYNFVGGAGLVILFAFVAVTTVVWFRNPEWHDLDFLEVSIGKKKAAVANAGSTTAIAAPLEPKQAPKPTADWNSKSPFERTENQDGFSEIKYNPEMAGKTIEAEPQVGQPMDFEIGGKPKVKPPKVNIDDETMEVTDTLAGEKASDSAEGASAMVDVITEENKTGLDPYDPTQDLSNFEQPTLDLLQDYSEQKIEVDRKELEANKDQIINTLRNYKIEITKIRATIGPTVTLYEIVPAPGVRISKIKNLEDDIALSLAALGIRIIAPIPGRGTIGIEVPNRKPQMVSLKEVIGSEKFKNAKMDLPLGLGKTIDNEVFVADLAKMPHLLIAGATGQGKSVGINTIITSILYKKHPSQVKLVLIDPKKVELFPYMKLVKHYLAYLPGLDEPIVTDTTKVVHTLNSLLIEMDERYNLLKKARTRNLKEYNDKFVARNLNPNNGHKFLPYIVLVIDEFADLIMTAGKEVELPIARLAQLSRAVGIHLIIATQRPSVNIITGVIKANFPARIAFKVTAKVDSRTILDAGGADKLIGRGDMLLSFGSDVIRLQCAFIDTPEVENVIDHIDNQASYPIPYLLPEYSGEDEKSSTGFSPSEVDSNFVDAARLVVVNQHGSTSMIQRRLKLGYNRAGRIMDQLEAAGIVGASAGSKPREVFVHDEVELDKYLEQLSIK